MARGSVQHSVVSDSCNPIDCNWPGSSVQGILQTRILEWVAIPFSKGGDVCIHMTDSLFYTTETSTIL